MVPRLVFSSTCGLAATATVLLHKRAQIAPRNFLIPFSLLRIGFDAALEARPSDLLFCCSFVYDPPLAAFLDPVLALVHLVGEVAAGVILIEGGYRNFFFARIEQ